MVSVVVAHVPLVALSVVPTTPVPVTAGATEATGATAATTAVASDVVEPAPVVLVPVCLTRIVEPSSALTSTYAAAVAPAIGAQLSPLESQRCHW